MVLATLPRATILTRWPVIGGIVLSQVHKFFRQNHAVMQVGRLPVYIAAGRFANIQKLFNLRMIDRKIRGVGTSPCNALTEGEHFSINHLNAWVSLEVVLEAREKSVGRDVALKRAVPRGKLARKPLLELHLRALDQDRIHVSREVDVAQER